MLLPSSLKSLLVTITSIVLFSASTNAQETSQQMLLDRLVGSWSFEFGEQTSKSSGEFKAEWILDKTFVQKKGFIKMPDGSVIKTTSLVTYVEKENTIRTWTFMSNGTTSVGNATWDPKKKILTEIREDNQFHVTTTTNWSKENSDSWKMVVKDKSTQEVLSEVIGSATKKAETK